MLKNLMVLPDGSELFSGTGTVNAIQSVTLTQRVNSGTELTLGSTCAAMLEATLFTPNGALELACGSEVSLYKVDSSGVRTLAGIFTVEKITRPSKNRCQITAYDRVSRLDRDLTQWLESLNEWPYSLKTFAQRVCSACNLTLAEDTLPNENWQIQKFSAGKVTGRKLIQWVGQACGRFCRATPDGRLEFAWYTPKDIAVTPGGQWFYYTDSLQREDYQVAPIDKVQIKLTSKAVGASYGDGSNAYVITGNYLLAAGTNEALEAVAEQLYEILNTVTYTPCRVAMPADLAVQAGDIVQVTDYNGKTFPAYIMSKTQRGQRQILESTGSAQRDNVVNANNSQYDDLLMDILELQMDAEGLRLENRGQNEKLSRLELSVDGIKTKVTDQETNMEQVIDRVSIAEQTAEGISLRVRRIVEEGTDRVITSAGYTFDETGLTVRKSGREIKTQITEDGMTVYKNNNAVLTANSEGVDAVDLHASTYLMIGGRSRFENYGTDRTGCFWIGG